MSLLLTLLILSAVNAYVVYRIEGLARRLEAAKASDPNRAGSRSAAGEKEHGSLDPAIPGALWRSSPGDGGTADVRRSVNPGRTPALAVRESPEASRPNRFVEQARRAVESRLSDAGFGVDDLAGQLGLSPRQVQRRLRESTGLSPNAFIRGIRLQEAARLLLSTDSSVAAIAQDTGFGSASHFSKCFRDFFGDTPMSYARKSMWQNAPPTGDGSTRPVSRPTEARAPMGRVYPSAIEPRAVPPDRS